MIIKLLLAFGLMALCVAIHAAGMTSQMRRVHLLEGGPASFWRLTGLLVRVAAGVIVLHLAEIAAWGLLYLWKGAMPDAPSAMYFSAVTYTTTGYGDLVLPEAWRLVGGVEALTGILMCGWSTGFFFAVVSRLQVARREEA